MDSITTMANFKTHISTSTMLGIGYGVGAYFLWDVEASHCIVAAGLCSLAGMLPDLDSDNGVPVRETLCFLAAIVPALMIERFHAMGLHQEQVVLACAAIYVGIRFGVGKIFRKYTVHRGMWHSIPAAAIAGLATFLVCMCPEFEVRLFKAWAVVLGFLSHLILDEIYAVDLNNRRVPRLKKSFGTALKFFGKSAWGNLTTYAKLAALVFIVMSDANIMAFFDSDPINWDGIKNNTEFVGELLPALKDRTEPLLR